MTEIGHFWQEVTKISLHVIRSLSVEHSSDYKHLVFFKLCTFDSFVVDQQVGCFGRVVGPLYQ